ncbi:hypothetical protein LIER_06953 [Lithospermum erythrorhizon]|uniref:Uncharacterized protein n=1 Tax=Lithospermum erythrorhizon TaxID=34254 RepID=A0AAV3P6A4_LITER
MKNLEQNHHLGSYDSPLSGDVERYRRLVRCLLYLSFTRSNLSFVVFLLSQFMHATRLDHWTTALRIVKDLKGSPGQDIFTKTLGKRQFDYLLRKLNIYNPHAPT